jgi:glycosyltransferase involved in cell wall biosynthesis
MLETPPIDGAAALPAAASPAIRRVSDAGLRPARPVLIVCLSSGFGGADVRVLQMAAGLHGRRDYAVATLTGSPILQKLREKGLNAIEMGRSRADPRLLGRFLTLLRSGRFQVVDAHNPQSQFWALIAARLANIPVLVSTVHHVYAKSDGSAPKRRLYRSVLALNRALGCRFVTVSKEIAASLEQAGIDAGRMIVSDNAVDMAAPDLGAALALRQKLGWNGKTVVGIFGRLAPQKGHADLLEALSRLTAEQNDLRCLVVGSGDLMAPLTARTKEQGLEGRVHFTGFRDDVPALMQVVDIICQPSLYEGLPYTVLEAAALGKPMILSRVGAIPDHFEHARSARLIEPGDVPGLVRELRWCCRNAEAGEAMGLAARSLVQGRFSLKRVIAETTAVYDR